MLEREKEELINAMYAYGQSKSEGNIAERMYRKGWFDCLVNERCMDTTVDNDDMIEVRYTNGMIFANWKRQ